MKIYLLTIISDFQGTFCFVEVSLSLCERACRCNDVSVHE